MNRFSLIFPIGLVWCLLRFSPGPPQKSAESALDAVLKKMDTVSANFHTTQAEFEWENYQRVINEVDDVETGTIYYRRTGAEIEMMAEVRMAGSDPKNLKPEPKFVLFSGGKIRVYQPTLDQVTVYDLGKKRADFESYVVLGFGGSGQDLVKAFDVTYVGPQTINGSATAELQLVPKSEKVRNTYNRILLWIDLDKGISVQQQFFTPQQDYRFCQYSSVQVNGKKIPDKIFRLNTTSKTQTISPNS